MVDSILHNAMKLMRLQQWLKNGFVFVGIFFAHQWHNAYLIERAMILALAFCFTSSAVYIMNDFFDRDHDRLHPLKSHRPLAARNISVFSALLLAVILNLLGLFLGFLISLEAGICLLLYTFINLAYSITLKNIVVIDVLLISVGFMLRVFAGTYGLGILPSHWLLLCGFLLTLFLGFGKRRSELLLLSRQEFLSRKVLRHYSANFLNIMISITAGGSIVSYMLYSFYQNNAYRGIYTIPFVIYGVTRYIYLLYTDENFAGGNDISQVLYTDWQLQITVTLWLLTTTALLTSL